MGYHSLIDVAKEWGLDQPVPVRPLRSLLTKLPQEIGDNWRFSDWLGINPSIDIEKPVQELTGKTTLTPLEILSHYSIDPDDGRDQNLFVRDEKGNPQYRTPD